MTNVYDLSSTVKKHEPARDIKSVRGLIVVMTGFFLPVVFLFPAPTAASGIVWTPSVMSATLAPGESLRPAVSFTASRHLSEIVVRIAPSLQPFVQVEPWVFTGIAKGQTVQLNVTIAVPPCTRPGRATGAIRLFHELHLGVKGGGIKILGWPLPFANPLLLTVEVPRGDIDAPQALHLSEVRSGCGVVEP